MRLFFTILLTHCVCAFRVGLALQHGQEGIPFHMMAEIHALGGRSQKRSQTSVQESTASTANNPPIYSNTPYEDYLMHLAPKLGHQLSALVDTLKGYFVGDQFFEAGFEEKAKFLNTRLVNITSDIHKLRKRQVQDMYEQLDYVNHMFTDMIRSTELLKHYTADGSPEFHLLHCMIELNILMYSLFDAYGIPDKGSEGFSYRVSRFVHKFKFCRAEFAKLTDVSIGVVWMFNQQCNRARGVLEFLESQIPINERFSNLKEVPW